MTRFMMSLDQSVELVEFAFNQAKPGDIFVQKSPASTVMDIALALKEIFKATNEIKIIGIRHGEKLYETLCTREEMSKAEDLGDFYRIPTDGRDLNYSKYFTEGEKQVGNIDDYNSNNTRRLSLEETKNLLLSLDYVQDELNSKK
jgi:UDP-glucose 4-epimerase